jgi:putative DNA methylase
MSDHPVISPKKLIEVALPLDAINAACAREKSIRHGHPSTLHLWWARRPLAAARSVIFAQLVNDPASLWETQHPGDKPSPQQRSAFTKRRKELFNLIEDLVLWENTTNEPVLERARAEIRRSWSEVCALNASHPDAATLFQSDAMPGLHDPFAGGGAIPLEAQRLGLDAYASDLNPVAVLINKAMIEIPPKFAGKPPVSAALAQGKAGDAFAKLRATTKNEQKWTGAQGLAEDVRHYGAWMREQAQQRIGHLYPQVEITPELAQDRPDLQPLLGQKLTVIAWLWARTVHSPNPAFSHVAVPLASTFVLSSKDKKEAYVHPVIEGDRYRFTVRMGKPTEEAEAGTKASGRGANFRCILSDAAIGGDYIKAEAKAGRMSARLMAVVAEGANGRVYLQPTVEHESVATSAQPSWKPDVEFFQQALGFRVGNYGMTKWSDLFTPRQLVALTTFSDLVGEVRSQIAADALACGWSADSTGLDAGGSGAQAYAEAVSVYLAFVVSRLADFNSVICGWIPIVQATRNTFGRQAIPMTWDFAELNVFGEWLANYNAALEKVISPIENNFQSAFHGKIAGTALQADAQQQTLSEYKSISTDPPYYDNIGYADLSDFFYVWLRKALRETFPHLLATMAVPKAEELVATPYRHGGKEKAEHFFLNGMTDAMRSLSRQAHPAGPITIYYAFKQSDTKADLGTSSTGWETFLEAVHKAELQLLGTWPLRTELSNRMRGMEANALASSVVLVCRKRAADAPFTSRREFIRELQAVLPVALDEMTRGAGDEQSPVAAVDLSQAIIGPGMAVFSKYSAVLDAEGNPLSVKQALQLINKFLAEDDFDADSQFCLHWFDHCGWEAGDFGLADNLSRSKGTSVEGVKDAGVVESGGGKVRLLKWTEYPKDYDPAQDTRTPVWETLHHLIRTLMRDGGEAAAGAILAANPQQATGVRQLAYRLYTLCERKGWANDAGFYNSVTTSWDALAEAAASTGKGQAELF